MIETTQEDVAQVAGAILANSSIRELRYLRVDRSADNLQLSGQVRSFYHKQLAQEAVRSVAGGLRVVNEVAVTS